MQNNKNGIAKEKKSLEGMIKMMFAIPIWQVFFLLKKKVIKQNQ
jgi:hypothetical protein